jgi:uncharacterized protein (TIGR02246 family)
MSQIFNRDDENAVRAMIADIEAGWNQGSGSSFAAPFAEDADYVIVDGRQVQGRDIIAHGHQQIFDTIYRGSVNQGNVRDVRFLRPDIAVAHVEWNLRLGGGDSARQSRAINTIVMEKAGGKWQIVAFHNSPITVSNS